MSPAARTRPRRTDAEIFAHARKALDRCSSIPGTVRVHIEDGVAWLTGFVRRMAERREAEEIVREVPGVQYIINKLIVARPSTEPGCEPPDASQV